MDQDTMYDKIEANAYESKLEYVNAQKDRIKHDAYRADDNRLYQEFKKDLRDYLTTKLGKPLTDEQFKAVFTKVWEDGHSSGYSEVFNCTLCIIELLEVFLKVGK